ncbi:MAG TPA: ABC transporter substrate-binding protein [Thermoleophilia bacterium]|nr:ABC transporter substrate-binding protein [Thermoleophilia bacterium]
MTKRGAVARLLVVVAAAAMLLVLAACGEDEGGGGGPQAGEPVQGGTLTVTFQGEPTELDPAIAWEITSWSIERLTYETFLTYASEAGEPGTELVPALASEVPSAENGGISADGKVYTFHLREGVKFAPPIDREVTAADFKWSFERMMKEPLAPATFFYTGIKGAQDFMDGKADEIVGFKAVDDSTVEITLDAPDSSFLMAMTMPFTSVMPKEWAARVGKDIKRKPLGTGPFVIKSWTPGQRIVAERNPNYWDEGKPYLDRIDFDLATNTSTALLRLQNGEVDVLGDGIPAADYQRIKNDPTWSKYTYDAPEIAWYYVFMNVLEKPFDDVRVRQAVNAAIDTAKIQKIMGGQAKALGQIYPDGMPGHQPDKSFYAYDPAAAKKLLAEAGYPDGLKTTFYSHNVDPFPKIAQAVQADLKAVGIEADIEQMDKATYWDFISLKKSHAGIGLSDWYQDFPDPSDWIGPLFIKASAIDGGANASFWWDERVEDLYAKAVNELDPEARIDMYVQMQEIIMEEAPTAPLFQPMWNGMYGKDVGGYYYHPVWNLNFQDYWKLDGK